MILILWYLNLVTPISLLANLVVVPIAFVILAVALLSLVCAPVLPWLSVVFNNANWCLARLVIAYRIEGDDVLILRVLRGSRDINALVRE